MSPSAGLIFRELFGGAPPPLGGQGEGAVFQERAGIDQIVDILPRRALVAASAASHGLGARVIQSDRPARLGFRQIGANEIQIDLRRRPRPRAASTSSGQKRRIGWPRATDLAFRHLDARHAAADVSGHHVLHLHGLEDRHRLARAHQVAFGDFQRPHGGRQRRPHRFGARQFGPDAGRLRGRKRRRIPRFEASRGKGGGRGDQFGRVRLDEPRGRPARQHLRPREQGAQDVDVGVGALDAKLGQGPRGAPRGLGQGRRLPDHLGQQGIVVGAGAVTGIAIAVDAHARSRRRLIGDEVSAGGLNRPVGHQALKVDPRLDGEAPRRRRSGEADGRQGFARRQPDLDLDEIQAGHLFGDGVLHLEPGVGLDEGEGLAVGVEKELDRADGSVTYGGGHGGGGVEQPLAQRIAQVGRGRDLQDLLVAPLQRTVALADGQNTRPVPGYLNLDMARSLQQAFGIERRVAKCGLGLAAGGGEGGVDLASIPHHPHAAAAAAGHGLDHHSGACRQRGKESLDLGQSCRSRRSGDHRHAGPDRDRLGIGLVAERLQGLDRGPDEGDLGGGAGAGEISVFRKKSISWMNGVAAGHPGDRDDLCNVQIGPRARPAQGHGVIGRLDVEAGGIIGGVDRGGRQAQFAGRPGDADRDFAAVGDQDMVEGHGLPRADGRLFWPP